ncbi:hypothetical protein BRARA_E02991 [Brassica rapa]|uniref:FBD domain-containing protein n=1 Tax=Brassica campestris TaxID=3711 RepID=A0A397ZEG5_BRACM|nr:hypothetical protein BRARA_E02991 [Brassica rapa]
MVLSKRWSLVWTMVPKLEYKDTRKEGDKSVWCLLDKSLQLHKATVIESLHIQVERQFCDDADVGKCVSYAVDHKVRELALILPSQPKILQLPSNVYTSKTLVKLTLSCRTLVVDVPSLPCLPSLLTLVLLNVVYKDQNSHVRLLSNCPALRHLEVQRNKSDNVTRFIVKVPSLKSFTYMQIDERAARSFVLDSPGLRCLTLGDPYGDLDSIQNMPHLEWATVCHFLPYPNDNKFLRSFSSVRILWLTLTEAVAIRFQDLPISWNKPSSVPVCLLSHLEIFVWTEFGGKRQEREFVAYILANSKCLKTVRTSPSYYLKKKEKEKKMEEFKSMYRVSASSQLLLCTKQDMWI